MEPFNDVKRIFIFIFFVLAQFNLVSTCAQLPALCLFIIDDLIPVDLLRPQTTGQSESQASQSAMPKRSNRLQDQAAILYAHVEVQLLYGM